MLEHVTPVILTLNEEANLERTLEPLHWAREIVVIDSGSTDRTLEICEADPRIRVIYNKFVSHADQWDLGTQSANTQWVMALDADYVMSEALVAEIAALDAEGETDGYDISFEFHVFGEKVRGTYYPPRICLYRRDKAAHWNEGHTQRIRIDGNVGALTGKIYHDDRKPIRRWFQSQTNYAWREVDHLLDSDRPRNSPSDRLRKTGFLMPLIIFFYVLFVCGCIFNGRRGLYYAMMRLTAEGMIATELLDREVRNRR